MLPETRREDRQKAPGGFIVSRPYRDSNIGSNLSSLAGAAWVASRLGREVLIDWRGLRQLRDPALNYFSEFFALPGSIYGAPVRVAPLPGEVYDEGSSDARWLSPSEAHALAAGARDPLPTYGVLQTYHGLDRVHAGSEGDRFRLLRHFYRRLRPAERIERNVDGWADENLVAPFIVGVNVRTGNGAYFGKGMRYADRVDISLFRDSRAFLRLLERVCRKRLRGLPRALRDEFQIFFATDSAEMSALLMNLPNAVTRRQIFPPPGEGDLYAFAERGYTDRDSIEDTIADMFLLARCDALVYNTSLFNQYARVVTGYFGGNHAHFEAGLPRKRMQYVVRAARRRLG